MPDGAGPCAPKEEIGLSLQKRWPYNEQGERAGSTFGRLLLWAANGGVKDRRSSGQALAGMTGVEASMLVSSEVLLQGPVTLIPDSTAELEAGRRYCLGCLENTTDSDVLKPCEPQKGEKWR